MRQVKAVNGKKELKAFIDFPHDLYSDDPRYVPELFIAQRDLLTKHPFLGHSSLQLFLAYDNGAIVGRIAAIRNNNHNSFNGTQDGFFGFFDTVNDQDVADMLLDTAAAWLRAEGLRTMIGPVNPTTNETCGMLVEGFDTAPVAMMTYNRPYYAGLVERYGLHKKTDLLAYNIPADTLNDRSMRLMDSLRERLNSRGITIRKGNMKNFKQEVDGLRGVYNAAWDKNLGFVPMTNEEFNYMAKDLKLVLDPDFCLVAEHDGKPVAFALCIPDINQVQIKLKRGRLLPTGIFKFLFLRKKINAIRVIALGVLEPYRKMGIEAVFYGTIIRNGLEKNMAKAEASWILEGNEMMNRAIEGINGEVYKRYRIYERTL
jgi:GNAT superfamily N-acetyltransferase